MSYEQFADDAATLLRALNIKHADVMGYSQGGGVAFQLALRHPTLVNKLVSMSATYRRDGWYPAVLEGMEASTPQRSPVRPSRRRSKRTRQTLQRSMPTSRR